MNHSIKSGIVLGAVALALTPALTACGGGAEAETAPMTKAQKNFVAAAQRGIDAAEGADGNEIKVVQARKTRATEMCKVLRPNLRAVNYLGTVKEVETTLGGDGGTLEIEVTDDIKVSTWNNGLSDIGDNTVIDPKSALYASLGELAEGDQVNFTGRFVADSEDCVKEKSLFDLNGMRHPDFLFRFAKVTKA